MANKWMKKLRDLEGVVSREYNPYASVIRTPSPSVNFSFGKGFGLPRGYSASFYGPPGGGKSLLLNATIGQLHQDDPEAIAVKFDTEFREEAQMAPTEYAKWGIDPERLLTIQDNKPTLFDTISETLNGYVQEGMPIALVAIDSINAVQGRRAMNQESIETQQIGDEALTIQTGLKRILPFQRKNHVALILCTHVRAEMDALEVKRGNKTRMAGSFGLQHHVEYFLYIERNRNAVARVDLTGKAFEQEGAGDVAGNADVTGHKIRTIMKKNSMSAAGRVGEFTLNYNQGIVNQHEEVFLLATNRGVIERPNQTMYQFGGKEWKGKGAMIQAIKDHPEMQVEILKELQRRDAEGIYATIDAEAVAALEAGDAEESPENLPVVKKRK
jgi:RecA/RadA recombinase